MEFFLGQLVALIAFFAFPAIQYVLLKSYAKNEGNPELWYLPRFGFRLVIRNLPGKKTLVDIKYRALLRQIISASSESSVATFKDQRLIQNEDFFLFPGTDQILISFKLKKSEDDVLYFVHTDKLGDEIESIAFSSFSSLISDYVATLENWFNFDVRIAKRAELTTESLQTLWHAIQKENIEQRFELSRIRNIW